MTRASQSGAIQAFANQKADEFMWGMPESPEFSAVQRLLHEFQMHENEERRWLSVYKKIAVETDDPLARILLDLIIADEERHDEMIRRMISILTDDATWSVPARGARKSRQAEKKRSELREIVDRLLAVEQNGIREYEKLAKTTEGLYHKFFALLCKTMAHDSLKHIEILDFLRIRLSERQRSRRPGKKSKSKRH